MTPAPLIDGSSVLHHGGHVHGVELDGEAVLLDMRAQRLHRLNPTATLVWNCLDGASTIAEITADLSDVLAAPVDRVLADVIAVCVDLQREGLAEIS
jgi:hypothetical protein